MKAPNLFIVGAPKCGTTALFSYLNEHPNAFMCEPKEPYFFCSDFNIDIEKRNLEEYLDLFSQAQEHHRVVGEGSVLYLYSKVAIQKIYDFNSDAKIIIMLRNPIDMVYSLHSQYVKVGSENEIDFERAWLLQDSRKQGKHLPKLKQGDWERTQYRDIGKLGEQVERVFSIFPQEQVRVILFEDFAAKTGAEYLKTLKFLNLPDDGRRDFQKVNTNKVLRYPRLGAMAAESAFLSRKPLKLLKKAIRIERLGVMNIIRVLNERQSERKPLTYEMKEILVREFREDVEHLGELLGRDLSHWMNHQTR